MSFLDKLDDLMRNKGINKNQLSQQTGIPYSTIDSFYKKGYDNVKLSTLRKLATFFGCSLDYLADDDVLEENNSDILAGVYLSLAKEAQNAAINPEDIRMAIKMIKEIREQENKN
ncbi:MAG: helix-turn-helix transcriptional regulator [Bacillota bacterium]